ncbi:MAG: hypothetical protein KF861_11130 [Planctomycetaceae bacterium]|nr:hypothetical protein [Planctomycetaceae bacterium]
MTYQPGPAATVYAPPVYYPSVAGAGFFQPMMAPRQFVQPTTPVLAPSILSDTRVYRTAPVQPLQPVRHDAATTSQWEPVRVVR